MPYPKLKTWTLNLGELDPACAEYDVVFKDSASIPAGTMSMISRAQAVFGRIQREAKRGANAKPIEPQDEWALTAPQTVLLDSIVSWNLPYPDDHKRKGKIIPLHDESEPDPLGAIPNEVYGFILANFMLRIMAPSKSPN